ncbi:MAG: hypothetical protein C0518_14950 [Opitutus sp.]|nr:hypothetical protein [Opitutus sp.]
MRSWLPAAVFALLAGPVLAVYYGETKEELLKELGKPSSALTRGGREILIYPKGGRIELEGGKVVVVQGLDVTEGPVSAPVATAGEPVVASPDAPKETETAEEKAAREAAEQEEKDAATERAKFEAEMDKAIQDLESGPTEPEESPLHQWAEIATNVIVKALMMLAALKLTTKYWDLNIEWGGLAIAAGADTAVRAVLTVLGDVVLKLPSMFYLDEVVAAFVLVAVLRKVSHNKSLARAITITLTSKVFSIVVGSMVAVAVMQGLFG